MAPENATQEAEILKWEWKYLVPDTMSILTAEDLLNVSYLRNDVSSRI